MEENEDTYPVPVKVRELVAFLLAQDQEKPVTLKIGSPVDSAWTMAEIRVSTKEDGVVVEGYVSSDDATAFFPGLCEG